MFLSDFSMFTRSRLSRSRQMLTGGLSKAKERELFARMLGQGSSGRKTREGKDVEIKVCTRGCRLMQAHLLKR